MSSSAKIGDCLPKRYSVSEDASKRHQQWWREVSRLICPEMTINAGIEIKKEIKMQSRQMGQTMTATKQPLRLEITQGENGYMVNEFGSCLPGRKWFALNADQLGKLLVKLAKEALPLAKV